MNAEAALYIAIRQNRTAAMGRTLGGAEDIVLPGFGQIYTLAADSGIQLWQRRTP
jgi:hypothetical protein